MGTRLMHEGRNAELSSVNDAVRRGVENELKVCAWTNEQAVVDTDYVYVQPREPAR